MEYRIQSPETIMTTLQELLAQKEALEQKIAELKKTERDDALRSARSLIQTYDLTVDELFGKQKSPVKAAAAKYRNPETGETWSGRGRAPRWLDGKNRENFAI
jgi:DNA-binding protein H-NS